jgi:hypothetical protein
MNDLDIARHLAASGIPVFIAWADPSTATGYRLPRQWEKTQPDPARLKGWRPGMAVCAVMGHGIDLMDVDPRHDGYASAFDLIEAGRWPRAYGTAQSASGGWHRFIASLGVRSCDNLVPGIDLKAGDHRGDGRGFAFLPPTVRVSKTTGQPTVYRWADPPDMDALDAARATDLSGVGIAGMALARQTPRLPLTTPPDSVQTFCGGCGWRDGVALPFCVTCCRLPLPGEEQLDDDGDLVDPAPVVSERYAAVALAGELAALAVATEGARNDRLYEAAKSVGRFIPTGQLDRDATVHALTEVAKHIGLTDYEIPRAINQGFKKRGAA